LLSRRFPAEKFIVLGRSGIPVPSVFQAAILHAHSPLRVMKIPPLAQFPWQVSAALFLALLVSGCETAGGVSTRAQEKSSTYTALKPWQKKYVDAGWITEGFTPDIVYIAMGKPDKVDPKEQPEGPTELWTYSRFYPHAEAVHWLEHANLSTDSDYAAPRGSKETNTGGTLQSGTSRNGLANSGNGGVPGGSMEPEDLRSYTVKVLFKNGKVARVSARQNP
jgi:hypothetical protein